ncbi:MAG: non-canonical purine NTP pyrophosphatase [Anaerolineae bacterium]|nr:non-canonical purine NTP pyrophosphatase [Anaerolineae bacterium]
MTILLLATSNPGKRMEMFAILAALGYRTAQPPPFDGIERAWHVVDAGSLGISLAVVEDGDTYAENAGLKARAYCQASGIVTLADDSGLEVDALDGAPGLHSARYSSKPGATDADRRTLLLRHLAGVPRPWRARFRCAVVIAVPSREDGALPAMATESGSPRYSHIDLHPFEGRCEGEIVPQARGSHGFGYDPIFYIPELGKTMAELETVEKNRISHRGRAIAAAKPFLDDLMRQM